MKALALEIRQAAKDLGMPVTALYKQLGVLSSSIAQWEAGSNARPSNAQRIRRKLALLQEDQEPVFTITRTVSVDEEPFPSEDKSGYIMDAIDSVLQNDAYTKAYKLELLRFILSK
jgi:predicted transcriptional regulator